MYENRKSIGEQHRPDKPLVKLFGLPQTILYLVKYCAHQITASKPYTQRHHNVAAQSKSYGDASNADDTNAEPKRSHVCAVSSLTFPKNYFMSFDGEGINLPQRLLYVCRGQSWFSSSSSLDARLCYNAWYWYEGAAHSLDIYVCDVCLFGTRCMRQCNVSSLSL